MLKTQKYNKNDTYVKCNKSNNNALVFLATDSYIKYLLVTLKQIVKKCNKKYEYIILCEDCSSKNYKLLERFSKKYSIDICIVDTTEYGINVSNEKAETWCKEIYKKIIITDGFFKELEKLLFIDLDVLIIDSFDDIFDQSNGYVSMALDVIVMRTEWRQRIMPHQWSNSWYKEEEHTFQEYSDEIGFDSLYCNGGVVLIDNNFRGGQSSSPKLKPYILSDQDYLNITYKNEIFIMPLKYNYPSSCLKENIYINDETVDNIDLNKWIDESINDVRICHCYSDFKPWDLRFSSFKGYRLKWIKQALSTKGYKLYFLNFFTKQIISKFFIKFKKIFK